MRPARNDRLHALLGGGRTDRPTGWHRCGFRNSAIDGRLAMAVASRWSDAVGDGTATRWKES